MYEAFYGLNEKPFNLTPDPRFLYLSSKHKEAFAHLLYGIRNRSGFVMVSGEIGTGKTTICRSLLKQLDPDTEVAFIFNPKLSPTELLRTINADFGIASKADTIRGLVEELNTHLLDRAGKGKNCVLIIDEAQNLGTETLEQVRLLSNLETETEKLLQIVLIGQPELAEKLTLNELRQLNQRITARYHLGSLSRDETLHYIAFRLRVAGGQKKVRFTRAAVRLVHRISRGTPRVINALCDRALLIGYTKEARTITPAIIRKSAREVQGAPVKSASRARLLPASLAATVALAVVAALFYRGDLSLPIAKPIPDADARLSRDLAESTTPINAAGAIARPTQQAPRRGPDETLPEAPTADPTRGIAEAAVLLNAAPQLDATTNPAQEPETKPAATLEPETTPEQLEKVASVPGGAESAGMQIVEQSPKVHLGMEVLVRAWGLDMKQVAPVTVSAESAQRFATANGLRLVALTPTMDEVLSIGLPALLHMRDGSWAALKKVQSGQAQLVSHDGEDISIELDALRDQYDNEAYYLWRDRQPGAGALRASMRGKQVEDLQRNLGELGLLDREPTGVYDAATIDAITKIQRTTGLGADGIAGPHTRMILASWLGGQGTPRLSDAGFTDSLRDRVLARQGIVVNPRPASDTPIPPAPEPEPAAEPAALPDIIEPDMVIPEAPAPEQNPPAEAEPAPTPDEAQQETYTPILPEAPPADPTAVTPAVNRGVLVRPTPERDSALQ